jgi:hypothetical protein
LFPKSERDADLFSTVRAICCALLFPDKRRNFFDALRCSCRVTYTKNTPESIKKMNFRLCDITQAIGSSIVKIADQKTSS